MISFTNVAKASVPIVTLKAAHWYKVLEKNGTTSQYIWVSDTYFLCFMPNTQGPVVHQLSDQGVWFANLNGRLVYETEVDMALKENR